MQNLRDGFWGGLNSSEQNQSKENSSNDIKMINDSITRIITEEELSKHNKDGDAWFAVNGHVYDGTPFLKEHPGGGDAIITASGEDATEDYMAIHSDKAKAMLVKYHIGILEKGDREDNNNNDKNETNREIFLNPKRWSKTTLKTKKILNHDTLHLTFTLEHPNQKLGIPIGKHLKLLCTSSSGEKVIRPYTTNFSSRSTWTI